MYKKLLISFITLFLLLSVSCLCFANDALQDAANGVRNVVGGAENAVEGAAKDVSNASKDATGDMENKANEITNNAGRNDATSNHNRTVAATTANDDNNGYTAVRTNAEGNATLMGMTATTWTWIIMAIAAVAIVALVWYYSAQVNKDNYDTND